jgi:rpsU-divergently transcribed protein
MHGKIRSFLPSPCRLTIRNDRNTFLSTLPRTRSCFLQVQATWQPPRRIPSLARRFASTPTAAASNATAAIDDDGIVTSGTPPSAKVRDRLLVAALEQVPRHGWTEDAIVAAVAGLEPPQSLATAGLLTVAELVSLAMDHWNEGLRAELVGQQQKQQRRSGWSDDNDKDHIAHAFQWRLQCVQDLVRCDRWHEAMAVGAQPGQVVRTKDQIADIVDITLQQCSSTYSTAERLGLGAVYVAAEFHMLSDPSENFQDTWAFLRKLVDDWDSLRQYSSLASSSTDVLWTASQVGSAVLGGVYTVLSRPTVRFGSHPQDYERRF